MKSGTRLMAMIGPFINLMVMMIASAIYIYFLGWKTWVLRIAIDVALGVGIVAVGLICIALIVLYEKLYGKQGSADTN